MKWLLLAFRLALGLVLAVEQYAFAAWAGPDLEVAVAPVLERQSIERVDLLSDGRLLCWTWAFDKARQAEVVDANWTLRGEGMVFPYERVRTVADSEGVSPGLPHRRVKDGQWSRKCVEVPARLVGRPFRLTGFVEYRTGWTGHLWTVRQPTAEADIPSPLPDLLP